MNPLTTCNARHNEKGHVYAAIVFVRPFSRRSEMLLTRVAQDKTRIKKTDTLATRDEVVSELRGTTLLFQFRAPEDAGNCSASTPMHGSLRISSYPVTGTNRDHLPARQPRKALNGQLRGELQQINGEKACSRWPSLSNACHLCTFPLQGLSFCLPVDYARFTTNCLEPTEIKTTCR